MRQPHPFPRLPDLGMPLRDALRGVGTFVDATERALDPVARVLPEPFRSRIHAAIKSIEGAGKQLINTPIGNPQLAVASDYAAGKDQSKSAGETCATVICHAWEHLHEAGPSHGHMISETILASRLTRVRPEAHVSEAGYAASLISDIRDSSAIGRMPGFASATRDEERNDVDVALVAIFVWLLSSRAETMQAETDLLTLSLALVMAIRAEVLGQIDDPDALSRILETASAHL